jgi:hypothetical protein
MPAREEERAREEASDQEGRRTASKKRAPSPPYEPTLGGDGRCASGCRPDEREEWGCGVKAKGS